MLLKYGLATNNRTNSGSEERSDFFDYLRPIVSSGVLLFLLFSLFYPSTLGRDSSVGIATRYWLDDPGIESRWGREFSAPVQTGGPT